MVIQRKYGRKQHAKCLRQNRRNRGIRRCPIYRQVATGSTQSQTGKGELRFDASKLPSGAYRTTLTATNANGTSNTVRTIFYRPWW